jgi:hypothetical protein
MTDTNQAIRAASYHTNYQRWRYTDEITEFPQALVSPQFTTTTDHDFTTGHGMLFTAFNGGVYDQHGTIVESALHRSMVRHLPDNVPYQEHTEPLSGNWLYGGYLQRHIGHMLIESLGRLWAFDQLKDKLDGVVFVLMNGHYPVGSKLSFDEWLVDAGEKGRVIRYFRELLDFLGIDKPIRVVGRPVRVEHLHVPAQGMGLLTQGDLIGGSAPYRAFIKRRLAAQNFPAPATRKLYISRARLVRAGLPAGQFFQESRLEQFFASEGYEIIYPELQDIPTQIAQYAMASHIVLPAGSAAHVAALCINGQQNIAVLRRFPRQNDQFTPQLRAMEPKSAVLVEALSGMFRPIQKEDWQKIGYSMASGAYLPDYPRLTVELRDLGFIANTLPHSPAIMEELTAECAAFTAYTKVPFEFATLPP